MTTPPVFSDVRADVKNSTIPEAGVETGPKFISSNSLEVNTTNNTEVVQTPQSMENGVEAAYADEEGTAAKEVGVVEDDDYCGVGGYTQTEFEQRLEDAGDKEGKDMNRGPPGDVRIENSNSNGGSYNDHNDSNGAHFGLRVLVDETQDHNPNKHDSNIFDVVAVHGIHSNNEDMWTPQASKETRSTSWLKNDIPKRYPRSRILGFDYDASNTATGIGTEEGIRQKAFQLLDDLVMLRKNSHPNEMFRQIVFVGHDLGGIIIKQALCITNYYNTEYNRIRDMTRLLIFFACPHRCMSPQDMDDRIAQLWFSNRYVSPVGATSLIKELGRTIIRINGWFANSSWPALTTIINIYSAEDEPFPIFGRYMATLEIASETQYSCQKPHESMCQEFPAKKELYEDIDLLQEYSSILRDNEAPATHCLESFRFLSAPVWPLESSQDEQLQHTWLYSHESYTEWLKKHGPKLLFIQGTTGTSDASEYIYRSFNQREIGDGYRHTIYFRFNRYDDRRNSVISMLTSIINQVIHYNQALFSEFEHQYEWMRSNNSWSLAPLLRIFENILLDYGSSDIMLVIDGLDECDGSRTAFLEAIYRISTLNEVPFKIAITSTVDTDIKTMVSKFPKINAINLDDYLANPSEISSRLKSLMQFEVNQLIQQRPIFCSLQETITNKLLECGEDIRWRSMILHQLRVSKTVSKQLVIQQASEFLSQPTLESMIAQTLAIIPSQKRAWARKVLVWTLYAFHPLNVLELAIVLGLEVDNLASNQLLVEEAMYGDLVHDLEETFGGIFEIKHNEVHFCHPKARNFLDAADRDQEHVWHNVKQVAHQEISSTCQYYLSLPQIQSMLEKRSSEFQPNIMDSPSFIGPDSLCAYATLYWPMHYRLISKTFRSATTPEIFNDTKVMRVWAEAYWWFSNPISRSNREFLSLLPYVSRHGLYDQVNQWLAVQPRMQHEDHDCALSLVEAAREGHSNVVDSLLSYGGYSQSTLQDTLKATMSCDNEDLLIKLVNHAHKNFKNFEWPSNILCYAVFAGFEDVVKKLLAAGASSDIGPENNFQTPLCMAARQGYAGMVSTLLKYKADCNKRRQDGMSPLHFASIHGDAIIIKLLLNAGADINALVDNYSPLYYACANANYEAVKVLIDNDCDIANCKSDPWSPLTIVADEGFVQCCQCLLESKKIDVEIEGWSNWTPLRYAASAGHIEICKMLLNRGANVNTATDGTPILIECISQGNLEIVKLMSEYGAEVNAIDSEGRTALQIASSKGYKSIVAYLLEQNAEVNFTNNLGQTSILLAAQSGFAEIMQLLIDNGADLHQSTKEGWTPIHLTWDKANAARMLLENGSDINCIANNCTPLYLAAINNQIDVVEVLLSFRPDLEIQNSSLHGKGFTALVASVVRGHTEIVRLLLEAGADVNCLSEHDISPVHSAVIKGKVDVLRTLLLYNPDLTFMDGTGNTALNCIGHETPVEVVKLLVNAGSNIDTSNEDGDTPLCRAIGLENLEVMEYLITKKAKINIVGGIRGGPLHIACRSGNINIVQALIDAGADVNFDHPTVGTPVRSTFSRCWKRGYWENSLDRERINRYLIEDANANVSLFDPQWGCLFNAACAWSTPSIVQLMLERDVRTDVEDSLSRRAIHFAAMRGLGYFNPVLAAGANIESKDKNGKTVLHYAVIGGMMDVVKHIVSLSPDLVDQVDSDGWTPLLWAARGCGADNMPVLPAAQTDIIEFLLSRGANPCVIWYGFNSYWSTRKVARYHGAKDSIIEILTAKASEKLKADGKEEIIEDQLHSSEEATRHGAYCDSCFMEIRGIDYKCKTCDDFDLCFKCYISKEIQHPSHNFEMNGPEFPLAEVEELSDNLSEEDVSSGSSSDDNESTEE